MCVSSGRTLTRESAAAWGRLPACEGQQRGSFPGWGVGLSEVGGQTAQALFRSSLGPLTFYLVSYKLSGACISHVRLLATLWTVARQAPPSMGFSRQESWSGLPCLLQGIFLTQGSSIFLLCLLPWQVDFLSLAPPRKSKSPGGLVKRQFLPQ